MSRHENGRRKKWKHDQRERDARPTPHSLAHRPVVREYSLMLPYQINRYSEKRVVGPQHQRTAQHSGQRVRGVERLDDVAQAGGGPGRERKKAEGEKPPKSGRAIEVAV